MTKDSVDQRRRSARSLNAGEATTMPPERASAVLPAGIVPDDEIVILLMRPSILYVPLACLMHLLVIAIVALGLALLAVRIQWIPWTEPQAYLVCLAGAAVCMGWSVLQWYSRVYVLTDRRIVRRKGVLRVNVYATPLGNIQHTSVHMRMRERIFGLGSIGFATAGSDTFDAWWVMVRRPFAVHKRVVEAIERYTNGR